MPTAARSDLHTLVESSLTLIEAHQHPSGAYPASPDYPVYRYSWLRDGAFIADAMSRAGRTDSADRFLRWCATVIDARADRIAELVARAAAGDEVPADEMLPTRYTLDGGDGDEPWWNFQLDGYGTWLWVLAAHAARHARPLAPYRSAIRSTVDYLTAFGDRPCYDWWEEHAEHRHVATLGAVLAGLRAAVGARDEHGDPVLDPARARAAAERVTALETLVTGEGVSDGHLTKWLGGTAVDGSLLACLTPFEVVDPRGPVAEHTYHQVRRQLLRGGVYRYLGDTFYGGGEWLILTAWLGWHEARTGRTEEATRRLDWIAAQATPEGHLPEQVSGDTQRPAYIAEWTDRWGPVATPLLWSHAMFVTLALEVGL
ncbi:glycoside hydrolase family 15 protein [Micromonospora narathiwatensis]|uniref:Glycosyl hydrolases family 15 n=1 Tax=Micromonospora narathiwatensis TaxID=299146 RepID=A0A1A8ZRI8_9ACTN|nr:glycoside hydrolase family 15 protein [Micromonospora narathiwatensis]SBT46508.1 Glycosyl hydrolases family 15 [Micromonospora narathiwatensis]